MTRPPPNFEFSDTSLEADLQQAIADKFAELRWAGLALLATNRTDFTPHELACIAAARDIRQHVVAKWERNGTISVQTAPASRVSVKREGSRVIVTETLRELH